MADNLHSSLTQRFVNFLHVSYVHFILVGNAFMDNKSKNIKFPYNRDKAIQVALWLLNRHGGTLDKLKLVKLMFFADREHLARFGRPIIGGNYCAMKLGPVLSEFLNDLNKARGRRFPLKSIEHNIHTDMSANEETLSESDIEVLESVDKQYGKYDQFRLTNITHNLKAWSKNYPDKDENTSRPMPYEDIFLDIEDGGMLDIIRDDQEAWNGFE